MVKDVSKRYALKRLTSLEWILVDASRDEHDPFRTIACIYRVDDLECDVVWLRDMGLRERYATPQEVRDAVIEATAPAPASDDDAPVPALPGARYMAAAM